MNFKTVVQHILDYLLIIPTALLPQHVLSRLVHKLVRLETPALTQAMIKGFCKLYDVKLLEAEEPEPKAYQSFNAFFTRSLRAEVRPLAQTALISPVDGAVSQAGQSKVDILYQAKGHYYALEELFAGDTDLAQDFVSGQFATLYLSPKDYHRIHMPLAGTLESMTYVPGRLYPVNGPSVRTVPGVFARNERVVCVFDTDYGKLAMVLVGAMFVGSIETVWAGEVTPPHRDTVATTRYQAGEVTLAQGEEMGRFNLGSTVILLCDRNFPSLELAEGAPVQMGQAITG